MSKKFLIDTSVIIDNPKDNLIKLYENGENDLFITEVVLNELDKHKTSNRFEVAISAREFFRALKTSNFSQKRKKWLKKQDSLYKTKLRYSDTEEIDLYVIVRSKYKPETLHTDSVNDAKIREVALSYDMTCITNDISFQIIAKSQGLQAESIRWNAIENVDKITFSETMRLSEEEFELMKEDIGLKLRNWTQLTIEFVDDKSGVLTGKKRFFIVESGFLKEIKDGDFEHYEIQPLNMEQKFYMKMLESNFSVMAVSGSTGSGKTLLALQEGIRRVKDPNSPITGIVYMRYTVNAEDKFSALGFRKGSGEEKLDYFNYPLYGAINYIIEQRMLKKFRKAKGVKSRVEKQTGGKRTKSTISDKELEEKFLENVSSVKKNELVDEFIKEYNIEVLDIAHARGITIDKRYVIIDENQNSPDNIVRLLGTRIGKNSVSIFMGDFKQVDHPYLTPERNGLITLFKAAKNSDFISAIKLTKTVRSPIADWFEQNIKGK